MRFGLVALLVGLVPIRAESLRDGLRARLDGGQPVQVVVLADSLGSGMDLLHPAADGYVALFGQMVARRYPEVALSVANLGVPGYSTADALASFAELVAPLKPHLAVIQLGGNDKGTGDGLDHLPTYEQNLRALIAACRQVGAACLLVTPPMHEPVTDMPYPAKAREVGLSLGVPVADADTVLKTRPHDYRGLFPYFVHPREYEHAAMARELYRALGDLLGRPCPLAVSFPEAPVEALLGTVAPVPVRVANLAVEPAEVTLAGEGLTVAPDPVTIAAGAAQSVIAGLVLPHTLSGGRSLEWPVWLTAGAGGEPAYGLARATVVPVLGVPWEGSAAAAAPVVELSAPHLSVGAGSWTGPDDLSARVWADAGTFQLRLRFDVRDDKLVTGGAPQHDGIEVFLDLRDDPERGRPVFSTACATLFLSLPKEDGVVAVTTATEDQPAAPLLTFEATFARGRDGYRAELVLPRAALDEAAGRHVTSLGLDIAVDDADSAQRKSQLIWLGRADNFVNPRRFGELRLDQPVPHGTVRVRVD